jgi:YjbE family integral membrane protein
VSPAQPDVLSALLAIVLIDLVLAGDNAIIIGIAARNVPKDKQRAVILWGTAGAIAVRALLTGVVVWLLKIPGFLLVGGLALVWIGWKLTAPQEKDSAGLVPAATLGAAVRTIVIADAVMGIDNVLAVGGAAQGSFMLVLIGLAISIPIVVWGSALVLKLVDRYPAITWLGAAVLGWTAAKMIGGEPFLAPTFARFPSLRAVVYAVIIGGLVGVPMWRSMGMRARAQGLALAVMLAWVSAFGLLEDRLGMSFDLFERWQWDDDWLDLLRWIGWIPLVVGIDRLLHRRDIPRR